MLLKFAIKDYIDDRKFKNLSENTIDDYITTLKEFKKFCIDQQKVNIEDITTSDIKSYLISRQEKGNKPATINHHIGNIRTFFKYLVDCGYIMKSPAENLKKIKTDIKIETFTENQIMQMLKYYSRMKNRDKTFFAYRDYTMIVTLLGTGIRRGELINLRWKDIDLINNGVTIFGKARKQRTIPITEKLRKELMEYQIFCQQKIKNITQDSYVFCDLNGKQLTTNAINQIFKRIKKVMNFKDVRLSAHTFRHTFAKNWIMNGGDVFSLQRILGHSTLDMTNVYVSLFGSALKQQNDKFNPLNNIEI
ncbi:MAG TPA: tyrosine-type recombinase/integrase [Thermoanaerobacterium sp.]|nr:tyrosine-type recombinase/integrase [Thermoanaerobacterium sp.]